MKLKKIMTTLLLTIMLIAQFSSFATAATLDENVQKSCVTTITAASNSVNLNELVPGDVFKVKIDLSNYQNINGGLLGLDATLEYDKNILEIIPVEIKEDGSRVIIAAANGWDEIIHNEDNLKFITTGNKIKEGTLGTIEFKVKENITNTVNTSISIKDIHASDLDTVVSQDATLTVSVVVREPSLESDVYDIDENNMISKIDLGTTVAEFKKNITSYGTLEFKDKDGKVLNDSSVIGTNATLTVGGKLKYVLAVTQDINGDGLATTCDMVLIKLHLIEKQTLSGAPLKAADIDRNKEISVNDVAWLKLYLIGKDPVANK